MKLKHHEPMLDNCTMYCRFYKHNVTFFDFYCTHEIETMKSARCCSVWAPVLIRCFKFSKPPSVTVLTELSLFSAQTDRKPQKQMLTLLRRSKYSLDFAEGHFTYHIYSICV